MADFISNNPTFSCIALTFIGLIVLILIGQTKGTAKTSTRRNKEIERG